MEQISDIKKRIKSVGDIRQTTRATQLISTVKMRRARNQLQKTRPFFVICADTMIELYENGLVDDNRFFQLRQKKKGETWRIGYFILTGDQGLAGAYNANVVMTTEKHIHGKTVDNISKGLNTTARLYVAGKIGKERLVRDGFEVVEDFNYPISEPTYYRARDISDYIYHLYSVGELDLVYFIYTRIESAVSMEPVVARVLPVDPYSLKRTIPEDNPYHQYGLIAGHDIDYYPSVDEVMNYLINTYLNGMVYGALAEAYASEQTARMTAMENATDSADDMMERLRLKSNQARQGKITNEISEIVGGAELLSKG
jgi:F-type H+-transporting ATPase subunit gamma